MICPHCEAENAFAAPCCANCAKPFGTARDQAVVPTRSDRGVARGADPKRVESTALHQPSFGLRGAYCVVLLGAVLPFGVSRSGWVALAFGGSPLWFASYFGWLLAIGLVLYRVYLVARVRGVLASPQGSGFIALLRGCGIFLIYVGVPVTVLDWSARPLIKALLTTRTQSGAEFLVFGIVLGFAGAVGLLGILMFEFSRMRAFELRAGS